MVNYVAPAPYKGLAYGQTVTTPFGRGRVEGFIRSLDRILVQHPDRNGCDAIKRQDVKP